ncbi:MAG TPA: phosphoglycerate mutase family protein [Bacteroidales bacterium]|nr:phosphoglycerate mutase family protein [Bacteroidales bacterium]HPT53053.1 phosphoglycerate mutase family protein [Bacteroidales bacterium]
MEDLYSFSRKRQYRAWEIIRNTRVIDIWERHSDEIHLIGSLKLGLLMKHRDIDFHIYSNSQTIMKDSFAAITELAANENVKEILYRNLINTNEHCLEWHASYLDQNKELWQIDMIHIVKGSFYDGYFENVMQQIEAQLTDEKRHIILQLKYETPEDQKIMGIEYYKAVIQDGVKSYAELVEWRKNHPVNGILEW